MVQFAATVCFRDSTQHCSKMCQANNLNQRLLYKLRATPPPLPPISCNIFDIILYSSHVVSDKVQVFLVFKSELYLMPQMRCLATDYPIPTSKLTSTYECPHPEAILVHKKDKSKLLSPHIKTED